MWNEMMRQNHELGVLSSRVEKLRESEREREESWELFDV
jgi:hypothetical protein